MVKVRFSHLQSLDPNNILAWLDSIQNQAFHARMKEHYDFYYKTLFANDSTAEEVKKHIIGTSCELVEILDSLKLDDDTLLAAFYFPLVSNGVLEIKELHEVASPLIYKIVRGTQNMSQIDVINFNSKHTDQISSIRHLLLSMADDYRSIIIKLAERIIFLRSLDANKSVEATQRRSIAQTIHEVYGSLANRLGIGQLKWEIEDLALKITDPDSYYAIVRSLGIRRIERLAIIDNFVAELGDKIRNQLKIEGFELYGRPKHIYSIHKKMQKKSLKFEDLYDLFAARVIVDSVEECYSVLSMVQKNYELIHSEYTDYISNPKPNGYQSIHIILKLTDRFPLELQIRTHAMHQHAEVGVAAHWQYKEGKKSSNKAVDKIAWLRKLIDWQEDISHEKDNSVADEIRQQLLNDRVYIFTPRGEVRDLPIGSTPLDFAYTIHTDIGHRCIGAKVENRIVSFSYELKTGDKVEILTQKEPNISRDWINFVKTARAKSKIASYFSKLDRDKYLEQGAQILEKVAEQHNLTLKQITPLLLKRYKIAKNYEELCVNFGNGTLKQAPLQTYLESIAESQNAQQKARVADSLIQERLSEAEGHESKHQRGQTNQIIIEGSSSVMYTLAKCCQPIPGDELIGYITKGRGVSIHKAECQHVRHLQKTSPGRIVSCCWNEKYRFGQTKMRARVQVIGLDRVGMLRDISAVLSSDKVTIASFSSRLNNKTMLSTMNFEVDFSTVEILNKVLVSISKISGVVQAIRV